MGAIITSVRFYDRAIFLTGIGAGFAVIGGTFTGVGIALRTAGATVWSQPWFDLGLVFIIIAIVCFAIAIRHYFAEQGRSASGALAAAALLLGRARNRLRSAPAAVANWIPFTVQKPIVWRGFPRQRQLAAAHVPSSSPSGIRIRYATYGPKDRIDHHGGADVAATMQALVDSGTTTFNADNRTLTPEGDPSPGVLKSLWIEWERRDGVVTENHCPEDGELELDPQG